MLLCALLLAALPNDPLRSQQWHFDNVSASAAWDVAQGDASVIIAIIDTGVQADHPDLTTKIVAPYDAVKDEPGANPDPGTESAHGTACAGIAAAETDNLIGVAGICPRCRLMPVKLVGGVSAASDAAIVRAIDYAWQNGAAVIVNSWGSKSGQPVSPAVEDAVRRAAQNGRNGLGALVVFAAGNGYRENSPEEMASIDVALAVGASEPDDKRSPSSNFGPYVPLLAPAASHTTDTTGLQGFAPGAYTTSFSGTSAAAPLVAGIAGVLIAMNPALTAQQVKAVLLATADKVQPSDAAYDPSGRSATYGFGRVNMLRAVQAVAAGQVCTPSAEQCGNGIDDDCNGLVDAYDAPCAPICTTSAECSADKVCRRGHCLPKVAEGSRIGGACMGAGSCGAQAICVDDLPGGYCTLLCNEASPCPTGSACRPFSAAFACFAQCSFNGDCREGYACSDGVCVAACTEERVCEAGLICSEGRCTDAPPAIEDAAAPENGSAAGVSVFTPGCRCGASGSVDLAALAFFILRLRARRAKR